MRSEVIKPTAINASKKRVLTGIKSFCKPITKMLQYYRFGELTLITGKTGSGKSTLLSNEIAMLIEQGLKTVCFSGELSKPQFKDWLYTTFARGQLKKEYEPYLEEYIYSMAPEVEGKIDEWCKNKWRLIYDKNGSIQENEMFDHFQILADRGFKVFAIDNKMVIDINKETSNKWEDEINFLKRLKAFAENNNVIVFFVNHPRKQGGELTLADVGGKQEIAAFVHNILVIERNSYKVKTSQTLNGQENEFYGTDGVISFIKLRETGREKSFLFKYDAITRRIYSVNEPEKKNFKFGWETEKQKKKELDI